MNSNEHKIKYWFPAKRVGLGWGSPIAWQGWLTLGIAMLIVVGAYLCYEHPVGDGLYGLWFCLRGPHC